MARKAAASKPLKEIVPREFWFRGDEDAPEAPYADNVADLIAVLQRLPKDMPVGSFGEGMRVSVMNINRDGESHVRIDTESDYCW